MKTIEAKTFTPIYDEVEDRIRLIINLDDINRADLMITRSLIIKIIPMLEEFYEKHYSGIEADEVMINSDSSKAESESSTVVKIDGELLLTINLSYNRDNQLTYIELKSSKSSVVATFNQELFNSFIKLLKNSIPKFSWGLGFIF